MRRLSLFHTVPLCLLLGSAPMLHGQEVLSGIAAVVNKEVITYGEVRDLVGPREKSARDTLQGAALNDKIKEIRLAAVNDLINRQLILQEFKEMQKKSGAAIPPHVLDEHIETIIREQFGGDRAAFIRTLAAQGFTLERFRQMEEEKIIVQAMRGQKVGGKNVIISDDAIRQYHQAHIAEYSEEEQVHLRMLVMKKSGDGSDNRLTMMQEIREKILGGAAFPDIARMYDESSNQESGGDWQWITRKTLNESLTNLAFSLKPGEISKIADLSGNYYLLYCEARKPRVTRPLTELRADIEKKLIQEERQKGQEEWLAKLRKKAFVKIY